VRCFQPLILASPARREAGPARAIPEKAAAVIAALHKAGLIAQQKAVGQKSDSDQCFRCRGAGTKTDKDD
jgi:hypothetical protein